MFWRTKAVFAVWLVTLFKFLFYPLSEARHSISPNMYKLPSPLAARPKSEGRYEVVAVEHVLYGRVRLSFLDGQPMAA
ncbi:hypothetical protein B0G81_0169 [Paraburkholderia sp. BL6665CI2N2]|nr:hypothetical protein B0G81_0169 [Paraburkholderia sp. BL6665CI2N2]